MRHHSKALTRIQLKSQNASNQLTTAHTRNAFDPKSLLELICICMRLSPKQKGIFFSLGKSTLIFFSFHMEALNPALYAEVCISSKVSRIFCYNFSHWNDFEFPGRKEINRIDVLRTSIYKILFLLDFIPFPTRMVMFMQWRMWFLFCVSL